MGTNVFDGASSAQSQHESADPTVNISERGG